MALTIISTQAARPVVLPENIKRTEEIDCDVYRGSVRSLIDFGLIRRDQLPSPGKASIAYFQGEIIKRKCKRDETYLRVEVHDDGGARVLIGVSHEVSALRRAAQYEARIEANAEAEKLAAIKKEKTRGTVPDPGMAVALKAMLASPAQFTVGDTCMDDDGALWEIVSGYDIYCVKDDEGPYLHESGVRMYYAYGYRAKTPGRDVAFFKPHDLWDADGEIKHLQLVSNAANGKR